MGRLAIGNLNRQFRNHPLNARRHRGPLKTQVVVERNLALAATTTVIVPPHQGDFAHPRQKGLRDLLAPPLHPPPAFRALRSRKLRVLAFQKRPVERRRPRQRGLPKLQLNRVEIRARTRQLTRNATEIPVKGFGNTAPHQSLHSLLTPVLPRGTGQRKRRLKQSNPLPQRRKFRTRNNPDLNIPPVAAMMNPDTIAVRQYTRMRGGHLRPKLQQCFRDARVPVSGIILSLVMPVGHLLVFLPVIFLFSAHPAAVKAEAKHRRNQDSKRITAQAPIQNCGEKRTPPAVAGYVEMAFFCL